MARILYGVQGDGFGHATRAHSVGQGLLDRGHDVRFVTNRRATTYLGGLFPERVYDIFGLCCVYDQGHVDIARTVIDNARSLSTHYRTCATLTRLFRRFRPDLVITDFEPFSAMLGRLRYGVPVVSLDNQHMLTHCACDHLTRHNTQRLLHYLAAYGVIRLFFGGAKRYLITTFAKAPVRYHPTTLVPPVLRQAVYDCTPSTGGYLLAYKGAGGENDEMRRALQRCHRMPIRAYGFAPSGAESGWLTREGRGHLSLRTFDTNTFLADLAGCAGVIATAGHSLVCEALHLGKPMLLVPVARQYEQVLNAHNIEKLGYGRAAERLSVSNIESFVDDLDLFRLAIAKRPDWSLAPVLDAIERELP